MNQLVLSGTAILVLSGTQSSCYRGPESSLSACFSALSGRSNFTNQKSFGFLLTDQTTSRVGRDWPPRADRSACPDNSRTRITNPKAHASQFQRQGAVA